MNAEKTKNSCFSYEIAGIEYYVVAGSQAAATRRLRQEMPGANAIFWQKVPARKTKAAGVDLKVWGTIQKIGKIAPKR
jgi:hypothetical protein